MTLKFTSIVEADAYFQKQFELLEQTYNNKKETLNVNSGIILSKLKERYEAQVQGLHEATELKLANLKENSEKAQAQITQLMRQRKNKIEEDLRGDAAVQKEKLLAEANALFQQKKAQEKELYAAFLEAQQNALLYIAVLTELREDYVENIERVNEEFEESLEQLQDTLEELEVSVEEKIEEKFEEIEDTLANNLDRLNNQEIDAIYEVKEQANEEELRLYEEFVEREQELEFRFSNEHIKIENEYEDRYVELQIEQRKAFAQLEE